MEDSIKGLQEKYLRNSKEMKAYYDKADKEGREFLDSTESEAFERILAENNKLEESINQRVQLEKDESKYATDFTNKAESLNVSKDEFKSKQNAAWNKYIRSKPLTAEDKNVMSQTRGTSVQIQGTTTLGGFLVPEEWTNRIDVARAYVGSIKQIATVINTSGGGALPYPKVDDTANVGVIQSEGTAPAVQDLTFGETVLGDNMYTSGIIKVSYQLMNDEAVDLVPIIGEVAGKRIERQQSLDFVSGDGSGNAAGFLDTVDNYNAGGDAALTSTVIYDLAGSVDPAYAANGTWCFNNSTLSLLKKLSVASGDNRPIWVPSLAESSPATVDGRPYLVCSDMPSAVAGNRYIAFGDFSKYLVRTIGGMNMMRMDERYADELNVGFMAYERADGAYIGATTGAIKTAYIAAT